ncbi:Leucine-rich repeat-containing G-protein coupled receptor 6-like 1 [Homarus americanus]|uniref:Leucine-rich repeat-containing G-protein coupled receptor 6-like 1 n=1 Tax=Homarus americanus TaxID=6706 RepID=A0A8J5N9L8_HOMAM|nr:Leucine-rich repeat-containing G-protein coupled receptor 6-like 1 [Homarus americanus]
MFLVRCLLLCAVSPSVLQCVLEARQMVTHTHSGVNYQINYKDDKSIELSSINTDSNTIYRTDNLYTENPKTAQGIQTERSSLASEHLHMRSQDEAAVQLRTRDAIFRRLRKAGKRTSGFETVTASSGYSPDTYLLRPSITNAVSGNLHNGRTSRTLQQELDYRPPLTNYFSCNGAPGKPSARGTAPPFVCDLCPVTVDDKNPLSPCTCVGNSGSGAGEISITCPPTTATTEQLHDLFTNTDFFTSQVFRFTLQGSNMSGVLSQELWGDLQFTQVLIMDNKITHVDNKAFNSSASTLTFLNLDNNLISYYVTSGIDDLPKLSTLVLKRNRIPIIFTNAFNYSSLGVLDLSSNIIDTIGKNAFAALDNLQYLYLNRNLLTSIDEDCFHFFNHNPVNYLTIDLSSNKISYINEKAFGGLRNLQIFLKDNQLMTISEKIFHPIIIDSQFHVYFTFDGSFLSVG